MAGHTGADGPSSDLLEPGERILWSGRPAQGIIFTGRDALLIPFSMLWGGFAIFWVVMASAAGAFALFGVPFVIVGLYVMVGRFAHDRWLRRRTYYAVTDRRVLSYRSGSSWKLKALDIDRLPQVEVENVDADGRGTVRFESAPSMWGRSQSFGAWVPSLAEGMSFLKIEDAMGVYRTVMEAARARRTGS